jgi:hypothetical protein
MSFLAYTCCYTSDNHCCYTPDDQHLKLPKEPNISVSELPKAPNRSVSCIVEATNELLKKYSISGSDIVAGITIVVLSETLLKKFITIEFYRKIFYLARFLGACKDKLSLNKIDIFYQYCFFSTIIQYS